MKFMWEKKGERHERGYREEIGGEKENLNELGGR